MSCLDCVSADGNDEVPAASQRKHTLALDAVTGRVTPRYQVNVSTCKLCEKKDMLMQRCASSVADGREGSPSLRTGISGRWSACPRGRPYAGSPDKSIMW